MAWSVRRIVALGAILLIVITAGYLAYRSLSADVIPGEAAVNYTSASDLRGSADNPASLENVTVDDDGTIHLAPQGQ